MTGGIDHRRARTDQHQQERAEQLTEKPPPLVTQVGEVPRPDRFSLQELRDRSAMPGGDDRGDALSFFVAHRGRAGKRLVRVRHGAVLFSAISDSDRGQIGDPAGDLGVFAEVVAGAYPVVTISDLQRAAGFEISAYEQDR